MIYLLPRFLLFFLCWAATAAATEILWPRDASTFALLLGLFWAGVGIVYLRLVRREPRSPKWPSRIAEI